ncbi:hypothetical protein CG51_05945 [Haematobacter missouriensis]|uniref:Resolvase HTH domain-containing protein n=1 Tax=Haematobacter missouriensis TaxID=366616 RepID=A0A212AQP8_9RHOB|nr:hypothetical protein [Haematobacter missouriensis]KFI31046.1 hypothetical protein CG51_05945 [Haematobacter missouriensis]OWJ73899.1 hypothetical protein CDV53_14310 [Haematobacter missouriensis]OWJ83804.1 hypothetical protein CDV52_09855 [Haematobacter missouriensis]
MWASVVLQAVHDIQGTSRDRDYANQSDHYRSLAIRWARSSDFETCCYAAGVEPTRLKAALDRIIANLPAAPRIPTQVKDHRRPKEKGLTKRDIQRLQTRKRVADLLAEGMNGKDISARLGMSDSNIYRHISAIRASTRSSMTEPAE